MSGAIPRTQVLVDPVILSGGRTSRSEVRAQPWQPDHRSKIIAIIRITSSERSKALTCFLFLKLSLERVFRAVAGFGKIAVRSILHGIGIAVAELVFHRVIATLAAFVRLLRTFSAVGVVQKMIAGAFFRHGGLSRALTKNDYQGSGYPESSWRAMHWRLDGLTSCTLVPLVVSGSGARIF